MFEILLAGSDHTMHGEQMGLMQNEKQRCLTLTIVVED